MRSDGGTALMYVTIAVLCEPGSAERRAALTPPDAVKLLKRRTIVQMQRGLAAGIGLADAAYDGVTVYADRLALVEDADVVLAVQPPALDVIDALQIGAVLICQRDAAHNPVLIERLIERRVTYFAVERGSNDGDLSDRGGRQGSQMTVYDLLERMLVDNVVTIDWSDAILAASALTHAGDHCLRPVRPAMIRVCDVVTA